MFSVVLVVVVILVVNILKRCISIVFKPWSCCIDLNFRFNECANILILDSITWTRLVWVGTAGKVIKDGLEGGGGGGAVGGEASDDLEDESAVLVSVTGNL